MEKTGISSIMAILLCSCVVNAIKCEFFSQERCDASPHLDCITKSEECELKKEPAYCFAAWHNNTQLNRVVIMFKGCIYQQHCRYNFECVDQKSAVNSTIHQLSCCCGGDNCNSKLIWEPATINTEPQDRDRVHKVLIKTAGYSMFLVVIYVAYKIYQFIRGLYSNDNTNSNDGSNRGSNFAHFSDLDMNDENLALSIFGGLNRLNVNSPYELPSANNLELVEEISRGRFGVVWKATLHKMFTVAVKIFPPQDENSWLIEREIYQLPFFSHENILNFLGAEKRPSDIEAAKSEYWLITAYHDCGSLCDYLKSNTLTWNQLCLITYSMANGLSYLHKEILSERLDQYKPIIVHRDFKSKNVLLKHDFTACISDFSVAVVLRHGKLCGDVHTCVGTSRYMAPEVLDGSIDYSNDTFLSVDIYACGLIMWELATRCTSQLGAVQEYRLPFEEEVGQHPSFEDMLECVVHKRLRPAIKDNWKKSHPDLINLCDTMEECWKHCAEDRLSAECIAGRCNRWIINDAVRATR